MTWLHLRRDADSDSVVLVQRSPLVDRAAGAGEDLRAARRTLGWLTLGSLIPLLGWLVLAREPTTVEEEEPMLFGRTEGLWDSAAWGATTYSAKAPKPYGDKSAYLVTDRTSP
jgi:hypothetical protein